MNANSLRHERAAYRYLISGPSSYWLKDDMNPPQTAKLANLLGIELMLFSLIPTK